MSKPSKRAGAPDWQLLLSDEPAIRRMTDRLMAGYSLETGGIPLGTWEEGRVLCEDLIRAATG